MSVNNDKADETTMFLETSAEEPEVDLKPKKPAKLAPQGIRTFTVCRLNDQSGVSGTGIVIEGIVLAIPSPSWLYRHV